MNAKADQLVVHFSESLRDHCLIPRPLHEEMNRAYTCCPTAFS